MIWWAMSAESAFLALQEIGLNPDPPEIERLSAIAIGKAPPRGDAAREQSLRRQIFLAAWNRRILIQFEPSRARRTSPRSFGSSLWRAGAALAPCVEWEKATSRYCFLA